MKAANFTPVALAAAVERLGAMPTFLASALASVPPAELTHQPQPGHFALVEHACHLRDLEREGYLARVRRMLAEREPALAPFDGDAVAAARDYPSQDGFAAAREFAAARAQALSLIAPLTAEELAREATFGDERVCFADVIAMMVAHDAEHRAEIERLVAGIA